MSIFNLFKKGDKKETQPVPVSVQSSISCVDEPKQTSEESTQPVNPGQNNPEGTRRVHNLIILDESGSMDAIYHAAITGVNETLQTIREAQKEHEDQSHSVTLITFDTSHYNQIYHNTPAERAIDITRNQYRPCGGTPLFDAMGRSINELRSDVKTGDIVLVTVITDGYENSSSEYNGKAIKNLIEAMKNEGWIFTYIGANQDVEAVAESMSIDNRLAFETNEECTNAMFRKERNSRKRFYNRLSSDVSVNELRKDYFDE